MTGNKTIVPNFRRKIINFLLECLIRSNRSLKSFAPRNIRMTFSKYSSLHNNFILFSYIPSKKYNCHVLIPFSYLYSNIIIQSSSVPLLPIFPIRCITQNGEAIVCVCVCSSFILIEFMRTKEFLICSIFDEYSNKYNKQSSQIATRQQNQPSEHNNQFSDIT